MRWTMHVEPSPVVSYQVEGSAADALRSEASRIWKGDAGRLANKVTFTIYDPAGEPYQACTRHAGGSWRARWETLPLLAASLPSEERSGR